MPRHTPQEIMVSMHDFSRAILSGIPSDGW